MDEFLPISALLWNYFSILMPFIGLADKSKRGCRVWTTIHVKRLTSENVRRGLLIFLHGTPSLADCIVSSQQIQNNEPICQYLQSYVIKSAPWTILWFRILEIFSAEYIKRLCVFMFQTCSNSQLLRRVLWISAEETIGASLKHKNTQPLYIFSRVRFLHLNRLKERTWLHSFV